MVVKIMPNEKGQPAGKLADAELHFSDGALAGLKLIGFGVWERRGGGDVTSPSRRASTPSTASVAALGCCALSPTPRRRNVCAISCCRPMPSTRSRRGTKSRSQQNDSGCRLGRHPDVGFIDGKEL